MVDPDELARSQRSHRARASVAMGEQGQWIISGLMRRQGLAMVERIETGMKPIRRFDPRSRRALLVGARPIAPVSGDWRALVPGSGRSVLCEVKLRRDKLGWSDLEQHQREALDHHGRLGGLSLLGWVHECGASLLTWPVADFGPGAPLVITDIETRNLRWPGLA